MIKNISSLFLSLSYARRDLRAGIKGFYIFLVCLILGVGAISGVELLSEGLKDSLYHNGRYILGGDIAVRTIYDPVTAEQEKFLQDEIGDATTAVETRAMVRRVDEAGATLVELKAVEESYPLYGEMVVKDESGQESSDHLNDFLLPPPPGAGNVEHDQWGAVIEKELLSRLNVKLGEWVMVGRQAFQIRGVIVKEPDRIGSKHFTLSPRMMISREAFAQTGLKTLGSEVYYDHKIKVSDNSGLDKIEALQKKILAAFPDARWKVRNFLNAAPRTERIINRLTLFLTLIGLTTLLIGGIGISNAVRGFLESKITDIATLKCLGASERFVFRVYILQVLILATLGVLLGLLLGIGASQAGGSFLTAKLALNDHIKVYPGSLALAAAFGYLMTLCASLWPVGVAIKTSPTDLFRRLVAPRFGRPAGAVIVGVLVLSLVIAVVAVINSSNFKLMIFFVIGIIASFISFYLCGELVKFFIRRVKVFSTPELRMAAVNLYRPGNISSSIVLSLGLGLTVLIAVSLVQYNFIRLVKEDLSANTPSFFFLDIKPDQLALFKEKILKENTARELKITPSLRGRVVSVNGRPAEEMLVDKNESWVINSDRGFTYVDELPGYSKVTEGKWWAKNYKGEPIVSIADNVQRAFDIGVGDSLTVNIMGRNITAKVANVREISWGSFTLNFAVTFAPGVLERIPSNYIATVIVDKNNEDALQNSLAKNFPNVTSVKVRDALDVAQTIIRGVAQAISISAAITLLAGVLVLSGGVAAARKRYLYDSIILKVLGASRLRILKTFLIEYSILGMATVFIAGFLGTLAAYCFQKFILKIDWHFSWQALLLVTLLCLGITLVAGFLGTWRVLNQKPAPYLRNQ